MGKFQELLEKKHKDFDEEINRLIKRITLLRKKVETKSSEDKKVHKKLDEVVYKLRELQYLITEIIELDQETIHMTTIMAMELQFTDAKHFTRDSEVSTMLIEMGTLAESFYYAAYRIMKIFEKLALPFKSEGIQSVKSFLSSHPEIVSRSIGSSLDGAGPMMKSEVVERHNTQKKDRFKDRGLYKNFEEFLKNMNWALDTHSVHFQKREQPHEKRSILKRVMDRFRR